MRDASECISAPGHGPHAVVGLSSARSYRELSARDPGAFDQRAEFGPSHIGMNLVARSRSAEPAIGPGDDPFVPDDLRKAHEPLRDQLGMFDQVEAMRHHAGDENL